jgi:hypothetical protein
MVKGTFGVAVLAAALLLVAGASATPPPATNLSVTAAFSNAVGAQSNPVYCPPTNTAGGCTASPAVQVRWGQPAVQNGPRSGLGFAPTAATSVPLDTNFVVGTLTHFNFAIFNSITSVDLTVHLTAHTATDGDLSFDLPFTLGVDETPNQTPCPFQVSPNDTPCPDAINLPAGGVHVDLPTGGAHPHQYRLTVVGFTTSASNLTNPVSQLITQEDASTQGFLVASISRDNVAPVTTDDTGSTTSGGSTTIDVLANDSDADGDALSASIATPPSGGTAVVNADGTITYTANDDFKGTDTFTYAASDGFVSTPGTVTVTVIDTTKPTITVPSGGVTAEATGPDGAAVTYSASASDNVDGSIAVDCEPPSGSTFSLGTHTVTCTATDAAGNTATQTFDVKVQDTTAPTLSGVPSNQTAEATDAHGATVSYALPTASDAVDPSPTVTCVPASGTTFALGTTTVSCTATDASGNTSAPQTFTVTVQDTTPPTVTVPSNMTVFSSGGGAIAVDFTTSASDLVDGSVPTTCTPPSGSTFPVGTTTVTCTATDAAGNTGSASFTVTVVPNRPPVCSAVSVQGVAGLWPVNHKLVLVSLSGASDPDGNTITYRIDGVSQDEPVTGGGSGNTAFDAQRASGGSVWLRSERAGSGDGRVYTIAFTVTDQYGLSCSGTVDVAVPHDSAHAAVKSAGSYNSFGS